MRLIDIISKVVLEQTIVVELDRGGEAMPDDEQRIDRDREEPRIDRDREEPRIDRDREEITRRREELARIERERIERERIERERRDREERPRPRPRVARGNTEEPPKIDGEESLRTGKEPKKGNKDLKKQNDNTNLLKTPKFDTHKDIRDIKKVQTKEFIGSVVDKIELQLKQQPAKVTQTLKKYNVGPKVMAKLAPLSKESFKTIMSLEGNGVKLPLLILLFKNKNKLYNSMKTGQPLTSNDVSPIGGGINYSQFWRWSSKLDKRWGGWLRNNVVKNFPEISAPTLSF